MPVKIQITDKVTGKTGKAALVSFNKRMNNLGASMVKSIPSSVYPNIANIVRGFFRDNYINRAGWKPDNFTSKRYKRDKDNFMRRGDSFTIGGLGTFPVIHGSEIFGRRTDAILEGISTRTGSTVKTKFNTEGKSVNVEIRTGIDSDSWEGGQIHNYVPSKGKYKGEQRSVPMTTENQLLAFSHMVSPGGHKSIFVKLTTSQGKQITEYLKNIFGKAFKDASYTRENV